MASSNDTAIQATEPNGLVETTQRVPPRRYKVKEEPSLEAFRRICEQNVSTHLYPLCTSFQLNIPVYDFSTFDSNDAELVDKLQDEWHHIWTSGPGVLALKNFTSSTGLIDTVNRTYDLIVENETGRARGDHFAATGNNSRIWNSLQKHCEHDPVSFAAYYGNAWLSHVSEAWLGPAYQITAQVNIVRPGGKPQIAHRDFPLGLQTADACARFPKAMQIASQLLTLQGAVVHSDMPLDSGPTRFLPFSQIFEPGYMAYRLPQFIEYFNEHWVSLPLEKGDAVFFNPALFHAAGENTTADVTRSANLLQISSAFGRPMESVNTALLIEKCWDHMTSEFKEHGWTAELKALVHAISSGYPFPTNLDERTPAPGGLAPASESEILMEAIERRVMKETLMNRLYVYRRSSAG